MPTFWFYLRVALELLFSLARDITAWAWAECCSITRPCCGLPNHFSSDSHPCVCALGASLGCKSRWWQQGGQGSFSLTSVEHAQQLNCVGFLWAGWIPQLAAWSKTLPFFAKENQRECMTWLSWSSIDCFCGRRFFVNTKYHVNEKVGDICAWQILLPSIETSNMVFLLVWSIDWFPFGHVVWWYWAVKVSVAINHGRFAVDWWVLNTLKPFRIFQFMLAIRPKMPTTKKV